MLFSNKLVSSGIMQPLRGETRKACTRPMEQPMLRNVNTSRLMQAKLCGKFVTVKMNYLINYISATGRLETSSCDKVTVISDTYIFKTMLPPTAKYVFS